MAWACQAANGATTKVEAADAVKAALGGDPPNEPFQGIRGSGWQLLDDQYYGDCVAQAHLMTLALRMLGSSALTKTVRASTDAGAGHCLDQEQRAPGGDVQYLILWFPGWNAFEGCCSTPFTAGEDNFHYAVWPQMKGTDDYNILTQLGNRGVEQYWVRTWNDIEPGEDEWHVIEPAAEGPIPVP